MSFYYFLFFLILIKCSEKNNNLNDIERKLQSEESDQYENIRIYLDYDCLISSSNKTNNNEPLKIAIEKAKNAIQELVKVKRLTYSIKLPDYGIPNEIPEGYEGCSNILKNNIREISNTDLVLFIREYSSQYDSKKKMDFGSSEILKHLDNDINKRPLIGSIIYGFNDLISDDNSYIQTISTIFLHEFTHILGFNKTILKKKNLIFNETVKNRMNERKRLKSFINGTKVLDVAKNYFNCHNLTGVELDILNAKEDEEDNSIHWSDRILLGDYMTTELYFSEQAISEITLALLEDLEWYRVNYYTGGLMRFGKNKGCNFITEDCIEKPSGIKSRFSNEFCSNIYNSFETCSSGRQSRSLCNKYSSYSQITNDDYSRTFVSDDDEDFTGFSYSELIEYCPYSNSINNLIYKENHNGNCKIGYNTYYTKYNIPEEVFSETSFCIFSSVLHDDNQDNSIKNILRPTCHKMSCSESSLTIQIGGEFIVCPQEGGIIKVGDSDTNYQGYLICPDYNLICTGSELCNNLFDCVVKKSIYKNSTYTYNYIVNSNVSIEITNKFDYRDTVNNSIKYNISEQGENGVCPKNCQRCIANKQCTSCHPDFKYYIGKKEGDNEQIKCNKTRPVEGYYNINQTNGKMYFYECSEHCITCKNATICEQCSPEYYINKTDHKCIERIPGCINYDTTKYENKSDNGGAKSYLECKDCNNTADYYCLDDNKTTCINMPFINLSLYYNMENKNYSCIQKCSDKFRKCVTCDFNTCTICNESNHFINKYGNCVKNITNCESHDLTLNDSQCLHCNATDNYYCIGTDRTQCQYISLANFISYYKIEDNENSCIELCNKTHSPLCLECDRNGCTKCKEGYFPYGSECILNITGCIDNEVVKVNVDNTKEINCNECNKSSDYYCLNENKSICNIINSTAIMEYYQLPNLYYPCYKKCSDTFIKCQNCDSDTCTVCNESYHFINNKGNCVKNITNCERHDFDKDVSTCLHCNESYHYYCIGSDRTQCQYISRANYISYYKIEDNENSCVELCNKTHSPLCLECDRNGCTKCKEGYFPYRNECILNITGCIDNIVINPDTKELACDECNKNKNYYCFNEDKTQCVLTDNTTIMEYYQIPNLNYTCYKHCENIIEHCIQCNSTTCLKCSSGYALNRRKTDCLVPPEFFREDVECNVNILSDDSNLNSNFDFQKAVTDYFNNLNHISKVDHYNGNDFTMTFYINSNCTDGLLSKGYFKIDTRELNKSLIEEWDSDFNYHLLGIYINYNYRSYLRFYDLEQNLMNPDECKACKEKTYIIENNLQNILNNIFGLKFTEFIYEKNIDIFSEDSDIYTDSCTNLTLKKIDIPIHLRKKILFLHEYFEPLMCKDIDCSFITLNYTNNTSVCQCKMNTNYESLFLSPKFEFIPYGSNIEAKGISEAAKVIKCMKKGISWSYFKNNSAAIISVIVFVFQAICYIAYSCFGKPIANIPITSQSIANPPKGDSRTKIYLFSDWDTNLSSNTIKKDKDYSKEEEEKVIQPRDDSGDQILEEEKSLNNDFFSDISIDTNAGGLFQDKKTNKSIKNEKSKKVLILLGNKSKKKVSLEHSFNQEEASESEDQEPLGKYQKDDNYSLCRNYWLFLSIKQHIVNYFSDIPYLKMTKTYIPLSLRFIRSLFIFMLSIILSILWLDQKYFEKKWNHFSDKYSFMNKDESIFNKEEVSLSERIAYAASKTIVHIIVDLIVLIFGDFIIGIVFFSIREKVIKVLEKKNAKKTQDLVLKAKNNYNIFCIINFILVIVFFLSICGFGVTYPGGVVDCLTSAIGALIFFEIVPFIWSLILALFRYFGYKKRSKCMVSFSEYFLY